MYKYCSLKNFGDKKYKQWVKMQFMRCCCYCWCILHNTDDHKKKWKDRWISLNHNMNEVLLSWWFFLHYKINYFPTLSYNHHKIIYRYLLYTKHLNNNNVSWPELYFHFVQFNILLKETKLGYFRNWSSIPKIYPECA